MNDEPVTSEMEAMLLFKQHKHTMPGSHGFYLGGRPIWPELLASMVARGLVTRVDYTRRGTVYYNLAEGYA